MKSKKGIKKLLMALALVLCVAAFVPATASVQAEAKTKKVTANKNYKKAPALKKGITYKIKAITYKTKQYYTEGTYVKFTAPATGTYKITINNITSVPKAKDGKDILYGHFYISKLYSPKYLYTEKVKTQGGKAYSLPTTTKYCYKKTKISSYTSLPSRYAKIKLKKGETIYMKHIFSNDSKKCTYNLKITK